MNSKTNTSNWTGGQFSLIRILIGLVGLCFLYKNWNLFSNSYFSLASTVLYIISSILLALGWETKKTAFATCLLWLLLWFNLDQVHLLTLAIGICSYLYINSLDNSPLGSLDNYKRELTNYSWSISESTYRDFWNALLSVWLLTSLIYFLQIHLLNITSFKGMISFGGFAKSFGAAPELILLEIIIAIYALISGPKKITWFVLFILVVFGYFLTYNILYLFNLVCIFLLLSPSWFDFSKNAQPELIFYDGECGLCHRWVKLVLSEDPFGEKFQFATIQSKAFERISPQLKQKVDSIVVAREEDLPLVRSSAVVYILKQLGGLWWFLSWGLFIIPKPIRDLGYDFVAAIRHSIFKKPVEACPMMPPDLKRRFTF